MEADLSDDRRRRRLRGLDLQEEQGAGGQQQRWAVEDEEEEEKKMKRKEEEEEGQSRARVGGLTGEVAEGGGAEEHEPGEWCGLAFVVRQCVNCGGKFDATMPASQVQQDV
jgi:hypothetical protein